MKSLADQLKQLGYKDVREDKNYERILCKKRTKAIKERKARKVELDPLPKDEVLRFAYETNNDDMVYEITAYVDDINQDMTSEDVTIISVNCVHIVINGQLFVADHAHIRSDEIDIDPTWDICDKITFKARIDKYEGCNKKGKRLNKYRLCNK